MERGEFYNNIYHFKRYWERKQVTELGSFCKLSGLQVVFLQLDLRRAHKKVHHSMIMLA